MATPRMSRGNAADRRATTGAPRRRRRSERHVAADRAAVHEALVALVIVRRGGVQGRAIVPEDEVADAPAVAVDESVAGGVPVELIEQPAAFVGREADQP